MRKGWNMGGMGLTTILRVLPPELYDLVTANDRELKPGEVFDRIVKGEYGTDYLEW